MNDWNDTDDSAREECTDQSREPEATAGRSAVSRRSTLAALAGLGIPGLGTGTVAAGGNRPTTDGRDERRLTVDGETVLRLVGPQSFVRDDGATLRDGGAVRTGSLNEIDGGTIGGTISGGGLRREDLGRTDPNRVTSHFGTVGGGAGNRAGGEDPEDGEFATVGGGLRNAASGPQSSVGGGGGNDAGGYRSAVIGGGNNDATDPYALVCGGVGNRATGSYAVVAGGSGNVATGENATVGGGGANAAGGRHGTVAGGRGNDADSHGATVAGGVNNDATGTGATVAGGEDNDADGEYSFAAGRKADTDGHDGAVVFGDSSEESIRADEDDAARFQMPVYARSFNSTSSRARKRGFDPVDPESVLAGVESLDVGTWEFERGDGERHIGPTAEAFHDAFELGDDDGSIATVDADGVALAAIQGLSERLAEKETRIEELEAATERKDERIEELEAANRRKSGRIEALEAATERKAERLDDLESRLAAVEAAVGGEDRAALPSDPDGQ